MDVLTSLALVEVGRAFIVPKEDLISNSLNFGTTGTEEVFHIQYTINRGLENLFGLSSPLIMENRDHEIVLC